VGIFAKESDCVKGRFREEWIGLGSEKISSSPRALCTSIVLESYNRRKVTGMDARVSPFDLSLVRVLNLYADVAPFLQSASAASDANRDSLGFVPRGVFEEFARRSDLFVLAVPKPGKLEYAGHLLFERRYPRAKIVQLIVLPEYRGLKYGRLLCDRLVELLTHDGFTSIYARVGEDMHDANEAWQAMGFRVQRTEPGGVTTGRTIVVRVRELESPQLFATHQVDEADPLGLARGLSTETPLFLIDLNVLFDLSPRRARHDDAVALFQAERADFCKLAISDEVIVELERTGVTGRPDPMMNFARTFSRFPVSNVALRSPIVLELARLVFPHKVVDNLSRNDVSDLRHLVTAIENNLAGLITNDDASLRAAPEIEKKFGVQVLSPRAFLPGDSTSRTVAYEAGGADLSLSPATDSDDADIRTLLTVRGVTAADLASGWSRRASVSFVVRAGPKLVAYMCWSALKHEGVRTIRAAIDESFPSAVDVARGVIVHCLNLNVDGPTEVRLRTPANQVRLRDIARGVGFSGARETSDLSKLACGRVATKANWHRRRAELAAKSGFKMDEQFPSFRGMGQQMPYMTQNGNHGFQTLERIETLLSPVLFCLPGRPAVITPILHKFANPLLGHSKQVSLLPAPTSNLFQDRHFISGPNSFNQLKRGTLMLFYESRPPRGKGELVAIARVRRSYLKESAALESCDLRQSVLSEETVADIGQAEMKTVTVFDNLFSLPSPIPLDRLQQLDCGRPIDLITTRSISDTQLQAILAEAFKE
jgi:GNAT superfamily N-acetyltransferase